MNLRIADLDADSLAFAVGVLNAQLPAHVQELGLIGESPADCYGYSLSKSSLIPLEKAEAESWAKRTRIILSSLQYFVAVDADKGNRLGVSGVYSVMDGYLDRESPGVVSPAAYLETAKVFWMGWTAVVDEMKGRGIGTTLMQHGIAQARALAKAAHIDEPVWAILADAGAVGFYEKKGFSKICAHGSGVIYADSLARAEMLVSAR